MFEMIKSFAATCGNEGGFFGLPTWYEYLTPVNRSGQCFVEVSGIMDIWLVALAILNILLRLAGLIAVGFVIYGGIKYVTSQGEPQKTKNALDTIMDALIGAVITITASGLVGFIAGRFN